MPQTIDLWDVKVKTNGIADYQGGQRVENDQLVRE